MGMKVAVLGGTGAMGGIFGAYLSRGGADVTLIDVSRPAIDAVNRDGLIVEQKDGTRPVFRLKATDDPAAVGPMDLVMVFVKGYHTEAAITAARPMIVSDTAVLTLQNGWGNAQRIGGIVGIERVLVGLTYNSGSLIGPGHVKNTALGMTSLGELSGRITPRLEAIADALRAGGFEITLSETIVQEIWKKLALNCAALPPSVLLRCVAGELVATESHRAIIADILREVAAVAQAQGIDLDFNERYEFVLGALARAGQARASMLQDVEAGRPTEIATINGAIVDAGRAAGVPTPVNQTYVHLIRAIESSYLHKA
jgi:2-dehydropantoate 2-reductase